MSQQETVDERYVLVEQISQGGVGAIWRARQMPLDRPVALKLLRPEMSQRPELRRRFAREARAASRLSHPNIAAVYDFGADGDRMFIAMELIEGDAVTRCIETGLSAMDTMLLADHLLAGLAHAHARGVIHRDLKPDNVLLAGSKLPDRLGLPKIVDFGIARVAAGSDLYDGDVRETRQDEVVGTPRYMSPEQAAGERHLGPTTDLYNVGLILYELVCGRAPFGESGGLAVMSSHVYDPVPPIEPRAGLRVPNELAGFIMRALHKDPQLRWQSAADMRHALEPIIAEARTDPGAQRLPRPLVRVSDDLTLRVRTTLEESLDEADTEAEDEVATRVEVPSVRRAAARAEDGDAGQTAGQGVLAEARQEVAHAALGGAFQRVPFVGRIAERERLVELASRTRDAGRGGLLLISGEAGVGKTRLTVWLKEQVEEHGILRAHLGAFTRGGAGGLRGIQEVLESLFDTRGMGREEAGQRIAARLAEWGQAAADDAPALTDFLRPDRRRAGETWTAGLSTSALFAAVTRVLELAARARPRLILLDDVHWAGAELGEFLDYLAVEMRHRQVPLLLVCTIRTEDLPENPALADRIQALSRYTGETVERIDLERLDREVGFRLVEALLPCDEALTETVYERSAGNPLHLVLLLRYLRDEGLLEWQDGQWHARSIGRTRAAMPPSLADLFSVRLAQVEERFGTGGRLAELMARAAIAGPRFDYAVLARMVVLEDDRRRTASFDTDFDRALTEGLIVELEGRGEDWYVFSHGLLRDYFLGEHVGPAQLKRLHRLAAQAMVDVYGPEADKYALEIAGHWHAGRDVDQALDWYGRAASGLRRASMYRQAAAAYEVCVTLMDEKLGLDDGQRPPAVDAAVFGEVGLDPVVYLETTTRWADLLEGFGEFDAAEEVYRRIVQVVGRDTTQLPAELMRPLGYGWLGLGHIAWQRGDFEAAAWAFGKVRELAGDTAGLEALADDATRGLARVAWHRGEYDEARARAEQALAASQTRGDDERAAEALWILGEVERMGGDGEAAGGYYEASLEIYRRLGVPTGIARNQLSRAQLARYHKEFGQAADLYQRVLGRYERLGDRRGAGQAYNGLGEIARFEGRFDDAEDHYERALEIYQAIGAEYDVAVVYTNLGLMAISRGEDAAAERYLMAAREMVAGEEYPYVLAGVECNLALVKARLGDDEAAAEIIDGALERMDRFPIPDPDYAEPLETLADLRAAQGRLVRARQLWRRAAAIYAELDLPDDRARVEAKLQGVA